jgi:uncharacterized protein YceK
MKKLLLPIMVLTALVIGSTSCSSIESRSKGTQSGLYPGVKAGKEAYDKADGITENSTAIIDLPFSFALDTVLLPLDLLGVTSKGEKGKTAEPAEPEAPQPKPAPKPLP